MYGARGQTVMVAQLRKPSKTSLLLCLSVCPHSTRKTVWTINTKLGTRILYSSRSAKCQRWRSHPVLCYLWPLPAWVTMSIRLIMFSSCPLLLFIYLLILMVVVHKWRCLYTGGEFVIFTTVGVGQWASRLDPCCQCVADSTWCYQKVCFFLHLQQDCRCVSGHSLAAGSCLLTKLSFCSNQNRIRLGN